MGIGENIKYYRKKKGLTQKELSNKSGVSISLIQKLEIDNRTNPSFDVISSISKALNISEQELFSDAPLSLGEIIAKARKDKGLTQFELGNELHVSSMAVSKWEADKSMPTISNLKLMSHILEIPFDKLVNCEFRRVESKIEVTAMPTDKLKQLIIEASIELANRVKE